MKYVLDSSVAFKWLVPEVDTDKALCFRDDYCQQFIDLVSPDVFPIETTHALTRAERQKRITPAEGARLFGDLLAYMPQLHSSFLLLPRHTKISSTMRVGVYDSLYVALAEREACEVVTSDITMLKNLQPTFPFIRALGSFP